VLHIHVHGRVTVLLRRHGVRDLIEVCLPKGVPVAFGRVHRLRNGRDSDVGVSSSDATGIVSRMTIVSGLVPNPFYGARKSVGRVFPDGGHREQFEYRKVWPFTIITAPLVKEVGCCLRAIQDNERFTESMQVDNTTFHRMNSER
jgi:hypothetical protein